VEAVLVVLREERVDGLDPATAPGSRKRSVRSLGFKKLRSKAVVVMSPWLAAVLQERLGMMHAGMQAYGTDGC